MSPDDISGYKQAQSRSVRLHAHYIGASKKLSEDFFWSSFGMPTPLSRIFNLMKSLATERVISILPLYGVYLTALSSRFCKAIIIFSLSILRAGTFFGFLNTISRLFSFI